MRAAFLLFVGTVLWGQSVAYGQPDDFKGVVASPKAKTLCLPVRGLPAMAPLPKKSSLVSLDDFQLTGPKPSHPFVLGQFDADGRWGMVRGAVGVVSGKNAALQLAWADEFELEGVMEVTGLGGWFMLLGWDEGRGYGVHNFSTKDSGSPWFVSEFRGTKAIDDRTVELEKFEWKGEQPFRLTVQSGVINLDVGRRNVISQFPLEDYQPGRIIIGTYDTRYGPRSVRIGTMKIRSLESSDVEVEKAGN